MKKINVDDSSRVLIFPNFFFLIPSPSLSRSFRFPLPLTFSLLFLSRSPLVPSLSFAHSFIHPFHHLLFTLFRLTPPHSLDSESPGRPVTYAHQPRAARRLIKHARDTREVYIAVCAPGRSPAPSTQARREEKGEGDKEKRKTEKERERKKKDGLKKTEVEGKRRKQEERRK